jgi:hypothetical protein
MHQLEMATNYRPVTLVPTFSKVLENVIVNQLTAFLDKHNILNKFQFGFRKKHSTNDAISTVIENITDNLNDKIKCNCVSLKNLLINGCYYSIEDYMNDKF